MREIVAELRADGPTEEEVERARAYAAGRRVLAFENTNAVARYAADQTIVFGEDIDPDAAIARSTRSRSTRSREVAAPVDPDALAVACVGPHEADEFGVASAGWRRCACVGRDDRGRRRGHQRPRARALRPARRATAGRCSARSSAARASTTRTAPAPSASAARSSSSCSSPSSSTACPGSSASTRPAACGTRSEMGAHADVHCYTPGEFERKRAALPRVPRRGRDRHRPAGRRRRRSRRHSDRRFAA